MYILAIKPIEEISIYNTNSIMIYNQNINKLTSLEIKKRNGGIYILELRFSDTKRIIKKLIVI